MMKKLRFSSSTLSFAVVASLFCGAAQSLEIGFEGLLSYELRQNTDELNFPDGDIPDTEFGTGLISVFGETRSRVLTTGFSGELETQKNLTADDGTYNTDSRFIGAAEVAITPRTLRWYFGDVLSRIRNEDAVRIADDINEDTINVFVTGPSYQSEIQGVSSTSARLFYVHQSEDDEEVQSLYNFSMSHQRDTTVGSFYGVRFNDIFTEVAEDPDQNPVLDDEDFNRMSLSMFTNRMREFVDLYGEIGVTRYTTDNDTTDGLTAELRATRRMGPRTRLTAGINHSLNDQTLNTIEALFRGDRDNAGLQPEIDGIFAETRLDVTYSIERPTSELEFGLSVAQLDYRLLTGNANQDIDPNGEDQNQGTLIVAFAKDYTNRLRGIFAGGYELEEYKIRPDKTDAYLVTAELIYTLTRSFNLELSLAYDAATGIHTRGAANNLLPEKIDESETRAIIGVRWVPPSRASRELTVEINSLLE
ncbi:MAG: hypothetical protein ACI9US_003500 [Gammaproteobacteria bacterium]|jgi:hypothetical protein